MPKNIVVFSDGTGQDGGVGHNTNVYKLFNMVIDRSPEQVAFYDRGLGTGRRRWISGATGAGIAQNIRDCYRFIFENFQAGDQIYLFGFSRGATTVRSLSGLIHSFGILPKSRPELIRQAYNIYKTTDPAYQESAAKDFVKRHHTMWTKIKFIGVWDTVAALGLPIRGLDLLIDRLPFMRHHYHDLRLSKSVEHAAHALAIDDERKTFHPTLWDAKLEEGQTMKQVWFCGMHTDVGGGYPKSELSDIPFAWMIEEAKRHGLKIYPDHGVKIGGDPNGHMHDSRGGMFTRFFRQEVRSWPPDRCDKPVVHSSVIERTLNPQNQSNPPYEPWILKGSHGHDVEQ